DAHPARDLRERGERRPALVERPCAAGVDEVVGPPDAVEPELLELEPPADDLLPRLERVDDGAETHSRRGSKRGLSPLSLFAALGTVPLRVTDHRPRCFAITMRWRMHARARLKSGTGFL